MNPTSPELARRPCIFGIASLVIGLLVVALILVASVLALSVVTRRLAALMLWTAVPLATLGMALAVVALIQPARPRAVAACALWINGVANVFVVPFAMALSLL